MISGAALVIASLFLMLPSGAVADDESECLLCHKHRGMSRIDEDGNFRLFYINRELFESSPHAKNQCRDCHTDIDRIPHEPAKKVDCTQQCHIREPSGNRYFSHKDIAETLKRSAHSPYEPDGTLKPHAEDYPGCKDCHDMPLYRPLSFYKGEMPGLSKRGVARCKSCHKEGNFAEVFYRHVTTRLHKTRTSMETIRVCARCHQDEEMRKRHELDDVVSSYKQTFHYKLLALGSERTPDCIDCHVVYGESVHLIQSRHTLTSSVAKDNVPTTCRVEECHHTAGPMLAGFQTHVTYARDKYPVQFYMLIFFKVLLAGVMYFFLTFVFLELLRRLFPNFSFNKAERAEARARARGEAWGDEDSERPEE